MGRGNASDMQHLTGIPKFSLDDGGPALVVMLKDLGGLLLCTVQQWYARVHSHLDAAMSSLGT